MLVAALGAGCSDGGPPIAPGPVTFNTSETTVASGHGTDSTGDPSSGTDASTDDTDTPATGSGTGMLEPPDYGAGSWTFENVSNTPNMGLHGVRAVLDSGQDVVAWAEVDPDDLGILNIFAAVNDGADWTFDALTSLDQQNTFPTMVGVGDTAYLAWTGRTGATADYDVFLASWNGTGWDSPRNLTDALDTPGTPEDDSEPVMVRRPGSLALAFTVREEDGFTSDVYVAEFLPDENPTSRELLIPASVGTCNNLTGGVADDGVAHFIAHCGGDLIHATDRSGDWDHDALGGIGSGVISPSARSGPDGEVHLVWVQSDACGTENCEDVFYAKTTDGVFGSAVNATATPNLNERMPAVGVDPWGRVLVFSQVRLDNVVHLRLAVSDDGGASFSESLRISPEVTADDYQTPSDVAFDSQGLASFVFELGFDGSDPLNLDIHLARFVP
jgi:hypothetical protein